LASQKFTRSKLKSIVKECLLEILYDGFSGDESSNSSAKMMNEMHDIAERPPQRSSGARPSRNIEKRSALDNIHWKRQEEEERVSDHQERFSKRVQAMTSEMTSDPVLSDIFADTAMTTLQEQVGADRQGPGGMSLPTAAAGDTAARIVNSSTPDELFAESAGKWASLAFADEIKR